MRASAQARVYQIFGRHSVKGRDGFGGDIYLEAQLTMYGIEGGQVIPQCVHLEEFLICVLRVATRIFLPEDI